MHEPELVTFRIAEMRVIASFEDLIVTKKILKHLDPWETKCKPRPVANAPPGDLFPEHEEQLRPSVDDYITYTDYPAEAYFLENLIRDKQKLYWLTT